MPTRTIERLQGEVRDALNLQPVLDAARKTDFDALNGWLVGRLSALLDERFDFGKLKPVQDTIHKVIAFRRNVYDKAVQAIERRSIRGSWILRSLCVNSVNLSLRHRDAVGDNAFEELGVLPRGGAFARVQVRKINVDQRPGNPELTKLDGGVSREGLLPLVGGETVAVDADVRKPPAPESRLHLRFTVARLGVEILPVILLPRRIVSRGV